MKIFKTSGTMIKIKCLKSNTPQELADNFGNLLAPFGNTDIRGCHIAFLEKKILENNEPSCENLSNAPYYYSWLILFVEHVFWDIKQFCFYHDAQPYHLSQDYSKSIKDFLTHSKDIKGYTEEEISIVHDIIIEFLIIRTAHVHGGFPNAIPKDLEKGMKKKIPGKDEKFTKEQVRFVIYKYSKPNNFLIIKDNFNLLYSFLKKRKVKIGI